VIELAASANWQQFEWHPYESAKDQHQQKD